MNHQNTGRQEDFDPEPPYGSPAHAQVSENRGAKEFRNTLLAKLEKTQNSQGQTALDIDPCYSDMMVAYIETSLTEDKLAEIFEIPRLKVDYWINTYGWKQNRAQYRDMFSEKQVKKNTVDTLIAHSKKAEEHTSIVANMLFEKAIEILRDPCLDEKLPAKNILELALKYKELEAKVTGQLSQTNNTINITQNAVYKDFMDKGAEKFYGKVLSPSELEQIE
jgi:hypothetical protein